MHRSQLDGPRHLEKLDARLALAKSVVLLVLAAPPDTRESVGRLEVAIALKTGVPVLIWHRQDCTAKEFRAAVDELLDDCDAQQLASMIAAHDNGDLARGGRRRVRRRAGDDRHRHPRCVNAPAALQNSQAITPPQLTPSTLDEVIDRVAYSLNLKLID